MRKTVLLVAACLLPSVLGGAEAGQLRKLFDDGHIFELRRQLDRADPNPEFRLYRGIVACRFGHEPQGIDILRGIEPAASDPKTASIVQKELAEAFERIGHYKDAANAWTEWLKLAAADDPDREENANTLTLLNAVADVPSQSVEFHDFPAKSFRAAWSKIGNRNVPVEVHGIAGQWIFDTGADESTVSESEAKRMGLIPREVSAWVSGSTGQRNSLKIAVAKDLTFGPATIHNVILLVLPDASLSIPAIHYQITGIVGIPVLRALGVVGIAANGTIRIDPARPEKSRAEPNLFFEGDDPIVEVNTGAHPVQMFLDTGANDSAFYRSFRAAMPPGALGKLKRRTDQQGGVGGIVSREVEIMPRLRVEIGGRQITLKKESLQSNPPEWSHRFRDGVIGMDALLSGYLLDFRTMRLELN